MWRLVLSRDLHVSFDEVMEWPLARVLAANDLIDTIADARAGAVE